MYQSPIDRQFIKIQQNSKILQMLVRRFRANFEILKSFPLFFRVDLEKCWKMTAAAAAADAVLVFIEYTLVAKIGVDTADILII